MQRARSTLAALAAVLIAGSSPALAYTVLGTGTAALADRDATDRDGNGDEACTLAAGQTSLTCGFDATFRSNSEPAFDTGEAAFNVFDNKVGGGNDKWCCEQTGADDPATPAVDESGGVYVEAEFASGFVLTGFSIASANDAAERDPIEWRIQGSNDGITFTDIYVRSAEDPAWTARQQVLLFVAGEDFPVPPSYRVFRYYATDVNGGTLHQIAEIELMDQPVGSATITVDDTCSLHDAILAANTNAAVGGCVAGGVLRDMVVLGRDVTLTAADTGVIGDVDHTGHTAPAYGASAGLPDVTSALSIVAPSPVVIARDPGLDCQPSTSSDFRLLTALATLELSNVTLRNGCVAGGPDEIAAGGAVVSASADLSLVDVVVEDSRAIGGDAVTRATVALGGGAAAVGTRATMHVDGSRFDRNEALGGDASPTIDAGGALGGGAYAQTFSAIHSSQFTGNRATGGDSTLPVTSGGDAMGGAFAGYRVTAGIRSVVVDGNASSGGDAVGGRGGAAAGAVLIEGPLSDASDLESRDNVARGGDGALGGDVFGGGIYLEGIGATRIERLGVVRNEAIGGTGANGGGAVAGAGMYLYSEASGFELVNATIAENLGQPNAGAAVPAAGRGAGLALAVNGALMSHVTLVGNAIAAPATAAAKAQGDRQAKGGPGTGPSAGGASLSGSGIVIDNTILLGNLLYGAASDCESGSVVVSNGDNRHGAGNCTFAATGDAPSTIAVPSAGDNGCETTLAGSACVSTVAIAEPSIVDQGNCANATADARGVARPVDIAGIANASDGCDIGAFEYVAPLVDPLFLDGFE